ncbi:hypothetical protein PQR64_15765 [Paraburkholderia phytofirmans]|uniref:hypothetical protein n=1 Tax=Paraburkholderia phytofirmans TaxID=261302 RepID=UPI0038B8F8DC
MKIAFFTEPGKKLPSSLRGVVNRGTRHSKIGLSLLQYPDGSFEVVDASRNLLKPDELERMLSDLKGVSQE